MLIGSINVCLMHLAIDNEYLQATPAYNFRLIFWINTLGGALAGFLSGATLVFVMRERFRQVSFLASLLINTAVILLLYFILSLIFSFLFYAQELQEPLFSDAVRQRVWDIQGSRFNLRTFFFWMFVIVGTIIVLQISDKYGPGMLVKMLLGKYHRPFEENRIFMFLDMRSSTSIAERLGHIQFHNLLNDFFSDITNPILYSSGEIYQYVGDEVIVSWTMEEGLTDAHCLTCYQKINQSITQRAPYYLQHYGLVPEFKAGLHCGLVTTGEIGVIKKDVVYSGDVLNTASRIQNMCNELGVNLLFSDRLLNLLDLPPHQFQTRKVTDIQLRGKNARMSLYTLD